VQCSSSHCLPTPTHLSTFLARHLGKVEYHCYLDSSPSKIAAVFAAFSYGFPFPCGNVWLCMAGNFGWQITAWLFTWPFYNILKFWMGRFVLYVIKYVPVYFRYL
jgi:hypothetical protein